MTKWYKPSERIPTHDQKVLIRHGDQIAAAFFDSTTGIFNLRDGRRIDKQDNVLWMPMLRPEVA